MGRWHHEREQIIRASGIRATFLRPGGFMTNAFDWLPTIQQGGYVLDPVGPGRYAPIDPADVAALALTRDGHQGQEYVLTGDDLFTAVEQVKILAAAAGRDIELRTAATRRRPSPPASPTAPPGAGRRHHRGIRPHVRRHRRIPHRHRGTPARPQTPHLHRLVHVQWGERAARSSHCLGAVASVDDVLRLRPNDLPAGMGALTGRYGTESSRSSRGGAGTFRAALRVGLLGGTDRHGHQLGIHDQLPILPAPEDRDASGHRTPCAECGFAVQG
jgi:hypothetical protein